MCILYIVPDISALYNGYNIKGGDFMPASKAQQKAVSKYMKENYDEIKVRVSKGQKDIIKAHAESQGESVNGFISRAIENQMERDKA